MKCIDCGKTFDVDQGVKCPHCKAFFCLACIMDINVEFLFGAEPTASCPSCGREVSL